VFLAALGGGGGVHGGDQVATGGNADVRAATGNKNFNIGGNPNVQGALGSPLVIGAIALIVVLYLWRRRK